MCQICGQPDNIRCNCQVSQPYCDQCGNDNACEEKIDAQCVFFHLNCTDPAGLPNLGIPCNTDLETILEALDDLVGNSMNIPFAGTETATIRWVANGPAGHKPRAHVKISEDAGNIIEERTDGIYAPEPDTPPAPVFVDETNDCITINVTEDEAGIHIIPSLDILCLLNKIRDEHLVEFCELVDQCQCLLPLENLIATFAPACPEGFTLNELGTLCEATETTPATINETVVTACATQYYQYSQYGALVYNGGFNSAGEGLGVNLIADIGAGNVTAITTAEVWMDDVNNSGTNDPNYGPANRAALWDCSSSTAAGTLGFIVPINVPTTKTYYVGIAADNEFAIDVDGVNVVTSNNGTGNAYWMSDGGAKFRFWHIYPINLTAGIHYISISGTNVSGPGFIAAEIYDNTLAELQAAALDPAFTADRAAFPVGSNPYSNLNLLFTTRCARGGGSFTVGNATCPDNTWTLDTTGGDPLTPPCQGINNDTGDWICTRTTTSPFSGYTATVVWDRIPGAINYTVQQKPTGDPDTSYVDCTGSPVVDPGTGTTATLVITGLLTDQLTFRVRANFADCSGEWAEVVGETQSGCTNVSIADVTFTPATVGTPYSFSIPLSGTAPFVLSAITKPAWMTIAIVGSNVEITGTPDSVGSVDGEQVQFTVTNCDTGSTTFNQNLLILDSNSFAEMMRFGSVQETICGQPEQVVYFTGAFGPGVTLYNDAAHSVPVTGFDFVGRTSTAIIYALNSATGVVGANTGNSC